MTILEWTTVFLIVLQGFPTWANVHEFSHVGAARLVGPLSSWSVRGYPKKDEEGFTWASSKWTWKKVPSLGRVGAVFLAPRIPDLVACCVLPFGAGLETTWQVVAWAAFWGAGIVDLGFGSVGWSPSSDLRRAATAIGFSPWVGRVAGFSAIVLSVGLWGWLVALR